MIELAGEASLAVDECDMQLYDVYTADEVFICSTAGGILPVVDVDGRSIGDGRPGESFRPCATPIGNSWNRPDGWPVTTSQDGSA